MISSQDRLHSILHAFFVAVLWFFVNRKTFTAVLPITKNRNAPQTRPGAHFSNFPLIQDAFLWYFWCCFIPGRPKTRTLIGFYVDFMNFKSSVLTAIQQIEVKCRFLASAIENGNYLTIQVHFDGNFDIIWSWVGLKHTSRSDFMWIMRISGWPF